MEKHKIEHKDSRVMRKENSQKSPINISSIIMMVVRFFICIYLISVIKDVIKDWSKPAPIIVNEIVPVISNEKNPLLIPGESFFEYAVLRNKGNVIIDTNNQYIYVQIKAINGNWSDKKKWISDKKGGKIAFPFSSSTSIEYIGLSAISKETVINIKQKK